jgi:uncharacterized protein YuzE
METLKFEDREPVTSNYDEEADVLYISFGKPEPGLAIDAGGGVLIRYRDDDGVILGTTIMGVGRMMNQVAPSKRRAGSKPRRPTRVTSKGA